jgi:D-apionolactonase
MCRSGEHRTARVHADPACALLAAALQTLGAAPARIAVFSTTRRSVDAARAHFAGVPVGGGTPYFFAQLNRMAQLPELDFVTFSTSPIVHVTDDLSVMQSLATLPTLVRTLRERGIAAPLQVGPVGIALSLDPFEAKVRPGAGQRLAMATSDARDGSDFGAAWAFAYLAQMAALGVEAVTFGHAAAFARCAALQPWAKVPLRAVAVSAPQRVAALAVETDQGVQTWVANLSGRALTVRIVEGGRCAAEVELAPHGVQARTLAG